MLQNDKSPSTYTHKSSARQNILLLLMAITSMLVLTIVATQTVQAQDRRDNDEQLQRLLKGTERASTIKKIPAPFVEAIKREYAASRAIQQEISFDAYLANRYFQMMEALELSTGRVRIPRGRPSAMCADGDCDRSLNPNVWDGAWTGGAAGNIANGNMGIATWTPGLFPNNGSVSDLTCDPDHASQAHHSIVPNGNDPVIPGLQTVAPRPASGNVSSLRLGNRCPDFGGERVTRTFTVTPNQTTLEFWYAIVAEDPDDHTLAEKPGFGAFLMRSDGTLVNGVIDIDPTNDGLQNFIVSDRTNPFFGSSDNKKVVYRDWTCVTINLRDFVGQTLTLVLVNRDCLKSAHWGYAYVDSFCLGCSGTPTGHAGFNPTRSNCAQGLICLDYTVPKLPNGTTGQVTLTLELYQNGNLVNTLTSGPLSVDGTFCFTNVGAGLDQSLGGFDWRGVANFTVPGWTISPEEIGRKGEGIIIGKNNDCLFPAVQVDLCCPPWNKEQLQSMLFYQGSGPISAPYTLKFQPSSDFDSQMKSYLNYLHSTNPSINTIAIDFKVHDHGTGNVPSTSSTPFPPGASVRWNWTTGSVTGPVLNPANFFTQSLQVGRWYRVNASMWIPDGGPKFPEKCANVSVFVRVQVTMNRSRRETVLEFNDGKKLLKTIPLIERSQQ